MSDPKPGQGRVRGVIPHQDRAGDSAGTEHRSLLATGLALLAAGISIFLVWQTVSSVWIALYLIGLPGPFVLGLQAGLSNFIPYLGPIVAAIPIALVAMPLGGSVLVWAVVVYTIIQSIEGYVIGPLIQRQAVATPPAWTLVAILLLGALFGIMGIPLRCRWSPSAVSQLSGSMSKTTSATTRAAARPTEANEDIRGYS